jgi:hypothetical protein
MQMEQVNTVKNDGRKVMKMTNLFLYNILIRSGLAKTLKSICQAPGPLIAKRGLICDHRNFCLKNLDEFVYF